MHVAVARLELLLPMSRSLKDKRQAARSLTSRIQNRFNVSVAEAGDDNRRQGLALVVASVANDANQAQELLSQVADFVEQTRPDIQLLALTTEVVAGF